MVAMGDGELGFGSGEPKPLH